MTGKCPVCGQVYENTNQTYCLSDGAPLVMAAVPPENTVSYLNAPGNAPNSIPTYQTPARKNNYLLIFGGIGILMIMLTIGVFAVVYFIVSQRKPTKPVNLANTSTQSTPAPFVSADKYKPELTMAINSANNAQTNAYATYDTTQLRNYYSGEALKSFTAEVENLKRGKIYQLSTLDDQQFEYFKVNDAGNEAEVRVVETWSSTVLQTPSKRCLAVYSAAKTPQTVYLKRSQTGWLVDATVYDTGIKRTPQPCPKKK